jgi:acyl-CoA thioesterase FadM
MKKGIPAEDVAARANRRAGFLLLPASFDLRVPDDVATIETRVQVQSDSSGRLTFQIYRESGGE